MKTQIFKYLNSLKIVSRVRKTLTGIVAILLFGSAPIYAQKEAFNWYMGIYQGVTFKSGVPEKLLDGKLKTLEGNSTISDAQGNLLFYTDGVTVWDRNHQVMPHGIGLKGHWSSTQSALIVPKPGDPTSYFIFTTGEGGYEEGINEGANYSEVSLCLNNGMGDVIEATKNTSLLTVTSERLAAVKHANGVDYWIVFQRTYPDTFYAYHISQDGVDMVPVNSPFNTSHDPTGGNSIGQMKISPNGKKLALAWLAQGTFEVFDFNDQTGAVSNRIQIPEMYVKNLNTPVSFPYGVEFSNDASKLYVTRMHQQQLLQYDLQAGDQDAIVKSRYIISGDTIHNPMLDTLQLAALQLAPDGKIYGAKLKEEIEGLFCISKPNEKGAACEFQRNVITWNVSGQLNERRDGMLGLPSFIASYFNDDAFISFSFDCFSPTIPFSIGHPYKEINEADVSEIHWNFGDAASGALNISDDKNPSHTFLSGGIHKVHALVTLTDGSVYDIYKLVTVPDELVNGGHQRLGNDTTLCPGHPVTIDASYIIGDLTWQDGSHANYFLARQPGTYWVNICRQGCSAIDSINVITDDIHGILGNDTTLCEKTSLTLDVTSFGEVLTWQDNATSSLYTITRPGTYWVRMKRNNCITEDSIIVKFCDDAIFIPNVITPNGDKDNNCFVINGIENKAWELRIYDRLGLEVYQAKHYQNDWDGNDLSSGIYYYYLQNNVSKKNYRGWVQIIR